MGGGGGGGGRNYYSNDTKRNISTLPEIINGLE